MRHIGVSNFKVDQMRRAQAIAPITSLQPPYSLISPDIEKEILPYAQANNIGVIVYSPHEVGPAHRRDDPRAHRRDARRRFPQTHPQLQRAAAYAEPGVGRFFFFFFFFFFDLYQIHWPVEDADIEEGWTAMAELKHEGKVRHIGVSNFSVEQMERCLKIAPITSLQPPYSLLNRSIEAEILPFCMDRGIGVINYSPQASGLLSGAMTKERVANLPEDDFRRNAKQFQEPLLSRNLALAELLEQIGARRGVSAGVVAIAWTLANPAITAAIVGGRSPQQVEGVWPAVKYRLTGEEMQEIQSFMDANR